MRARRRRLRPELRAAIARREIAQDRVRFPNRRLAVLQHRDSTMRIECEEFRRFEPAERAADLDLLVRQAELTQEPHHFLHVDRSAPAPDRQHRRTYIVTSCVKPP